jgi:hypothetical protein
LVRRERNIATTQPPFKGAFLWYKVFRISVQLQKVAPLVRLERTTRGLGNRCSIHLSYRGTYISPVAA